MGSSAIFEIVLVPALIAGVIYLALAYIVLPLIRKHRQRYAQYLPVDSFSERAYSLRSRVWDRVSPYLLPPSMRWRREIVDATNTDDIDFAEEEGESMVGFDVERRDRLVRGGRLDGNVVDSQRRLSRELEEGFKDDSDDESEEDYRGNTVRISR